MEGEIQNMKKSPFPTNISLYLGNDASRDFFSVQFYTKKTLQF